MNDLVTPFMRSCMYFVDRNKRDLEVNHSQEVIVSFHDVRIFNLNSLFLLLITSTARIEGMNRWITWFWSAASWNCSGYIVLGLTPLWRGIFCSPHWTFDFSEWFWTSCLDESDVGESCRYQVCFLMKKFHYYYYIEQIFWYFPVYFRQRLL